MDAQPSLVACWATTTSRPWQLPQVFSTRSFPLPAGRSCACAMVRAIARKGIRSAARFIFFMIPNAGLAAADEAQFSSPFRSEGKARDNDAVAWLRQLVGAGESRADVTKATGQQARRVVGNRRGRIRRGRVVQKGTVQEVRELHAKVQAHPFPHAPGPPE